MAMSRCATPAVALTLRTGLSPRTRGPFLTQRPTRRGAILGQCQDEPFDGKHQRRISPVNWLALELLQAVKQAVNIPVIASSGAGDAQDFVDVFKQAHVDAALAAGIFHNQSVTVPEVKQYLKKRNLIIRE